GGVAGLWFAKWVARLCVSLIPDGARSVDLNLALDSRVLAFTMVASCGTGIAFGLLPAWQATRVDIAPTLKKGAAEHGPGSGGFRAGRGLVAAQIAISVVLLIGAGLFLRSFQKLEDLDPGFASDNLLMFSLDTRMRSGTPEQAEILCRELLERLR